MYKKDKRKNKQTNKQTKNNLCVISMENKVFVDPACYFLTLRDNPRSDFTKMVLNRSQGSKKNVKKFQWEKI